MCRPVTLHHNSHGYVTWCKNCNYLSVAFGNTMMALLPGQLSVFMKVMKFDLAKYANKISEGEKAFVYESDSRYVKIILNYRELDELDDLLGQSLAVLEARSLINPGEGL